MKNNAYGFALMLLSIFALASAENSMSTIKISKDNNAAFDALPSDLVKGAEEAYGVNKKGLEALEKGNLDSAMALFSRASSMLPVYVDADNNKGVVHFRLGNIPTAKIIWKSVVAKDPTYAVAYYNLGVIDFYDKDYEAASMYFNKALALNKKLVEALVMLGRCDLGLNKKKEASSYFKQAYALDKSSADVGLYAAFGLISAGDTAQAESVLVKLKRNAEALKMLGQIESSKGNYAAAATYFSEAISGGALPDLLLELAWAQIDAKKFKDALANVKSYSSKVKDPAADAFLIGGIAAKELGDLAASTAYFEKGAALYPADPILRFNLGQIYFLEKQYDKAESTWKTLSDTASDPSLYYMKALSAKQRGDFALAEELIKSALKLDARAEYLDFLGVVLYARGKKEDAMAQFKKALAVDPELRSAQLDLALCSESAEGLESAAQSMEAQYASCGDQCADKALQLSIVYYHQGKLDKAVQVLEKLPDGKKDLHILRHLALYLRQAREWDKAVAVLEKARRDFVLDSQSEGELADDYLMAGHFAKAIEALKDVLSKSEENPWRSYYQLGYAYFQQNDLDNASKNFQLSIKSKSDNPAAEGLLALVYNMQGNSLMARTLWEKNLRADPSNPVIHINLGLSLEKESRFEEALDHYNRAWMLMPGDNSIMINIANAYEGLNRNVEAMNAYGLAMSSSKRNLAAYDIFLLAQKTRDKAKAQEMFSILCAEFPSSLYAKRAQAEMFLLQGDTAKAINALESLQEKDPVDWYTLARIYTAKKDPAKARSCLDMLPKEAFWDKAKVDIDAQRAFTSGDFSQAYNLLATLDDTSFTAQYNLALAALQAKKYSEALTVAQALVQKAKGKDRADLCRLAGNACFGLKQWKKSREWYEQLVAMESKDPVVQYNCAVASYNLGEIDASWTYYQAALALNPAMTNKDIENRYASIHHIDQPGSGGGSIDPMDSLYNEAVALQRSEKNDDAQEIYKRILDKSPSYSRAWNNLGAIYSAKGDLKGAEGCFLKSVEKVHDIPEAYANLVNVYIALDSLGAARGWLLKGIGHNPDSEALKDLDSQIKSLTRKTK